MSGYACASCRTAEVPDLIEVAKQLVGLRWWMPPDLAEAQADAVHLVMMQGRCERHAAMIGDFYAHRIRIEALRRTLPTIPPPPRRE